MNINKKIIALTMAAAMTVGAVSPAAIYAEEPAAFAEAQAASVNVADSTAREWETDIKMSVADEQQLMEQGGISLKEWDENVSGMKQAGLAHPLTEEGIKKEDAGADIRKEDGVIFYIGRSSALPTVKDVMDAYKAVYSLAGMLGGDEKTDLRLWSKLERNDLTIYSFQQVSGNEEVLGSVIKIAADADGNISAVFSGLAQDSSKEEKLITQEEAAAIVGQRMQEEGKDVSILPELTERVIYRPWDMERALNLDVQEDNIPQQVVWIVYTENDDDSEGYGYLAHYLLLDGTYLYSLPVKEPGDEEAKNGYRKQDVFEGMEADTFTGEVTTVKGETRRVTVPVMHSTTDGRWYLGDVERRIAIADFKEAAYGDDHALNLLGSSDNRDWDSGDIILFMNYIRAYDFYEDMGWHGPDGNGTDVIILKNLCTSDGTLYENACSIGMIENYQMFGYTPENEEGIKNGLGEGLDVLAHEYTHTFTSRVMNDNLYENDLGAINEAMSDIMGNLVEYICRDTDDLKWMLGENTASVIRCMSEPELMGQPAYVWDVNYGPHTDNPSETNDRGGVHINSSLLNKLASHLCLNYGMSHEEAVSFWTMAAMGLTPRTDYVQIPVLLNWAADECGLEKYKENINELSEAEQLERTTLPETLPDGTELVILPLPDTEVFDDPNWALIGLSVNGEPIRLLMQTGLDLIISALEDPDDLEKMSDIIRTLTENLKMDTSGLSLDLSDQEQSADEITEIIITAASQVLNQNFSWEEGDTGEIPMMKKEGGTLYTLINMKQSGTKLDGLAVLIGDRWFDLSEVVEEMNSEETDEYEYDEEKLDKSIEMLSAAAESLVSYILNTVAEENDETQKSTIGRYLPSEGLEDVKLFGAE